jgi:hypothetical protein
VRCESIRHFRNKKKEYLKDMFNGIAMNSKNKNIKNSYRIINEFNWGYQPRSNFVTYKNGDLLADSQNSLNRWKNYFLQLWNVCIVSDVRQIEIRTPEPLVPGPSHLEVEIDIAKLRKCTSPGNDKIPAELIQAGGETLVSAIHRLINSIWNEEEMPDQWKELLLYQFKKG